MQKMLVPLDGSESSVRALRFVLDQPAAALPGEIHLLNVQDYPIVYNEYLTSTMIEAIREGQMLQSRKVLNAAAGLVAARGLAYKEHIVVGFPDEAIVEQATLLGCEQIVMGTRGLGSIKSIFLGSVARRVVHFALVPVTLVK